MVNKKDLCGGAEKMREVAQLLCLWAEDLEAAVEKKGEPLPAACDGNPERGEVSRNKRYVRRTAATIEDADRKKTAAGVAAATEAAAAAVVSQPVRDEKVAGAGVQFEDLRGLLAEKSAAGYRTQVIALIRSFGVEKLSGVDPAHYGELWDAASCLGESLSTAGGGKTERDEITRNGRAPRCGAASIEGAGPEGETDAG